MQQIRILLADDHPTFRTGLATLLSMEEGLQVVGEAGTGEEAVAKAAELQPDVILMDIQMPVCNGIEATRRILAANPDLRILVVTMFEDDRSVAAAMRAGARGYVLKGALPEEITRAIRVVAGGEAIFSPAIAARFVEYFDQVHPSAAGPLFPELTQREREVLELIARGYKNHEIVAKLVLSPATVRNHITNILSKLQVADRAEAIQRAREAGLG